MRISAAASNLTAEVASLAEQAAIFKTGDADSERRQAHPPVKHAPASAKVKKTTPAPDKSPVKSLPVAAIAERNIQDDWNAF